MDTEQQLATLRLSIRRGESETQRWRVAGLAEKYLESFCNVESLERQLDELMQAKNVAMRASLTPGLSPTGER